METPTQYKKKLKLSSLEENESQERKNSLLEQKNLQLQTDIYT
jgi:hypothetical protein